jgi:hypothetical protein
VTEQVIGEGWVLFVRNRFILLRFNHAPDGRTLAKLRASRFTWGFCEGHQCWFAAFAEDTWAEGLGIANDAETWESVGEDVPSVWDGCDPPREH